MKLVLATFNRDKLSELSLLLAGSGIELTALLDHPGATPPEETGVTLEENARLKARAALLHIGLPAVAEDTGLEVDALDGRPGLHAARYAGPGANYTDNLARLLDELRAARDPNRSARFRTVCLVSFPGGAEIKTEGVLEGRIAEQPRGTNGFGYDPVFEVADLGRTLAELSIEEKNRISHRARAVRALVAALRSRL